MLKEPLLIAATSVIVAQAANVEDSKLVGLMLTLLLASGLMQIKLQMKVTALSTKQDDHTKTLDKHERQIARIAQRRAPPKDRGP